MRSWRDMRGQPRDWISPRRKRFWAMLALATYTLAGFFVVPWIAQRQIVQIVGDLLDRPVRLDEVRVNPFVLSAEARGFAVTEPDGAPITGFERLYVNFQLSSLFRWAWTFREITLERPTVTLIRFDDGTTNLGRLLPAADAAAEPAPSRPTEDAGPVRAIVQAFNLLQGAGEVTDHVPKTTFSAPFGPIDIVVRDVSTLPDDRGRQRVSVRTEGGAAVAWEGTLQVQPPQSSGRFAADGPFIPLAYRYFQDQLGAEVHSGNVALTFDYAVSLAGAGGLEADVTALDLAIGDVRVTQDDQQILAIPALQLQGGHLAYPDQVAGAARLAVTAPEIFAWLDRNGTANVARLLTPGPDAAAPAATEPVPAAAPPGAWALTLDEFELADLTLQFEDRSLREPGRIHVTDLDVGLRGLSNAPSARFPLTATVTVAPGGDADLTGEVGFRPHAMLDAQLRLTAVQLAAAQPYLSNVAAVGIDEGTMNADTTLSVSADEPLAVTGSMSVDGLSTTDLAKAERLLGWQTLAIDRFDYSAGGQRLAVSEVRLASPYVRLLIDADQTTNFGQLLVADDAPADAAAAEPEAATDAADPAPAAAPLALRVGQVRIESGSSDFTDLTLPLPFRSTITALEGELTTLDSTSAEPSQVRLQGQIADYGLARVQGSLMPLGPTERTDLSVLFRNVALPDLTPYTIRFAGREIDDGRLELDLRYRVDAGRLAGQNRMMISDLALGDRVEHPDAFDLPLGLAIALLKGPDGRIDLDVPVTGDLNDPQFRIGGVIMRAIANVLTGIVTSPFRLLGNLVGVASDDFGQLEFEPGSAELTPPEREKLHKLAEALTLRPQLVLEVAGVFDPEADRRALQVRAVQAQVAERLAADAAAQGDAGDGADVAAMLSTRRRAAMEALFADRFPDADLDDLRAGFRTPADSAQPEGDTTFDETAYVAELERRLVAATAIDTAALEDLARQRVAGTVAVLSEDPAVDAARIRATGARAGEMRDSGWIRMPLEVSAR